MKKKNLLLGSAVLALVAISLSFFGDISRFLKADVLSLPGGGTYNRTLSVGTLGSYAYNDDIINYEATNFLCNPGPLQTSGKFAGSYNTYYHSYAVAYSNSGVPGNWCSAYSSNTTNPPLKAGTTDVYVITDANGNEDLNNALLTRWLDHVTAAKKHEGIIVFYGDGLSGSYTVGGYIASSNNYAFNVGASSDFANGQGGSFPTSKGGFFPGSIVHCPVGDPMVDHTTYGAPISRAHLTQQNNAQGFYDGDGHRWCARSGVAENPLLGVWDASDWVRLETTYPFSNVAKLIVATTVNGIQYYKYVKSDGNLVDQSGNTIWPSTDYVKCRYTMAGPFTGNTSNTNGQSYYKCVSEDGSRLVNPEKTTAPITWTLLDPTNLMLSSIANPGNTTFVSTQSIPFSSQFQASGTLPSTLWVAMTVKVSTSATNFSSPIWQNTIYNFINSIGQTFGTSYASVSSTTGSGTIPVGGPYYFCVENSAFNDGRTVSTADTTRDQKTNCVVASPTFTIIAEPPATCEDPDGENATTMNSTTSPLVSSQKGVTTRNTLQYSDSCSSRTDVFEYYCNANKDIASVTKTCQYGCFEGKCRTQTEYTTYSIERCGNTYVCNNNSLYGPSTYDITSDSCIVNQTSLGKVKDCSSTQVCNASTQTCDAFGTNSNLSTSILPNTTNTTTSTTTNTTNTNTTVASSTPRQCSLGEVCPSGSWCYQGKQCNYGDGGLTCVDWQKSCPFGTKRCAQNDSNCIEPSATGPVNGWCVDSMECFTADGTKKYCQPNTNNPANMIPTTCPVGYKICSPNDSNCTEPGKYGPLNAWCKNSQQCYKKDGTGIYCAEWPQGSPNGASSQPQCPLDTGFCNPTDTNCLERGETGPGTAWCGGGGSKQCYLGDGSLYCAGMDETCPSGSGVCRQGDTMCVEPGKEGSNDGWCGGNAVSCYKKDGSGMTCVAINSRDSKAWESIQCPQNTGRCRAKDQYCLELGQSGPSGSWCASGMTKWKNDGTMTCVSRDDITTSEVTTTETEKTCLQVITSALDPNDSSRCKNFSSSCNVPEGWKTLEANMVCENGIVLTLENISDKETVFGILQKDEQHLLDLERQMRKLPEHIVEKRVITDLVKKAFEILKEAQEEMQSYRKNTADVEDKLKILHQQTFPEIESKMAAVRPYLDFLFLEKELLESLSSYKAELAKIEKDSEYYAKLDAGVKNLEALLESAKNQRGQGLEKLLEALHDTKSRVEKLIQEKRSFEADSFIEGTVQDLIKSRDAIHDFIEERKISDVKTQEIFSKFESLVNDIQKNSVNMTENGEILRLIDKAISLRDKLKNRLHGYVSQEEETASLDDLFAHLEEKVAEKVDKIFQNFTNKLEIVLDEALQKAAVKLADLTERFSESFTNAVSQSVSNITAVGEKHRDRIIADKNIILERVDNLEKSLEKADLGSFTKERLKEVMQVVATRNWCGGISEDVKAKVNSAGLALEANEFTPQEIETLASDVTVLAEENNQECYTIGAASFLDVPMHEWYFAPAEYNTSHGYVRGYGGDRTGQFGAINPTLRIEALVMAMRIFGLPLGNSEKLDVDFPGVPDWGYAAFNGALAVGYTPNPSRPMDQPITRWETAELFATLGKKYIDQNSTIDSAKEYLDYTEFAANTSALQAIDALSDVDVFQGSQGKFHPNDPLVRSEFATINQRLTEGLGLETSAAR
ncbi:hypothetical protein HZA38_00490 [Candidatus Peregrinibacteria bacterium]|nr:hypothetical protein [Candidatus Peregrinibacteria bacterium]